jgi:lysozyme
MGAEDIKKCKEQIKRHEGLRLKPYQDTLGFWTVGYGHFLGKADKASAGAITLEEAEEIFEQDFWEAYNEAKELVVSWGGLTAPRQSVLVNMTFNMGAKKMREFRQTLAAIEAGDYQQASDRMLASKWAGQVSRRAIELAMQMKSGDWQEGLAARKG